LKFDVDARKGLLLYVVKWNFMIIAPEKYTL
jgi:hypothetical protein